MMKRLASLILLAAVSFGFTHGVQVPPAPPGTFSMIMNLSGAENSPPAFTGSAEIGYWVNRGFGTFRFPINWLSIQPTVSTPLNTTYLASLDTVVATMQGLGARIIVDIHNFGTGPNGAIIAGSSGGTTIAQYADLCSRIATHYASSSNVDFDMMNEWVNGFDSSIVLNAQQACIISARLAGFTGTIYAEGTNFTGSWNWVSGQGQPFNNANLYQLTDPLNNLIFEAHMYPDPDSSGTNYSYSSSISISGSAPPGVNTNPTIGTTRLTPFFNWCSLHVVRCMIGENGDSNDYLKFGGNDNYAAWNAIADNTIALCQTNNVPYAVWGAGAGFGTPNAYAYNPDPSNTSNPNAQDFSSAGLQATQTVIFDKYTGYSGSQPTAYRIDLPVTVAGNVVTPVRYGSVGVASGNFTIRYNGEITSAVTITPTASLMDGTSGGGTFTPATVTLAPGNNAIAYFTYTPSQQATLQISATSNAGWIPPPPVGFSSFANDTFVTATNPQNIYGMFRLYTPYIGPAYRFQRTSDNAQMDFYFNNRGDLPRQAIQTWAGGRSALIAIEYDQSPVGNNKVPCQINGSSCPASMANPPTLTLVNAAGYPEMTITGGQNMVAQSPAAGQGKQTILARVNATNSNPIISQDAFSDNFRLTQSAYFVASNNPSPTSVSLGSNTGSWASLAGSWSNLYSTNNVNGYQNGTLTGSGSVGAFTFASLSNETDYFGFRFSTITNFVGSKYYDAITYDELSPTIIAARAAADATYYSTPLPDPLSGLPLTITGLPSSQATVMAHFIPPFGIYVPFAGSRTSGVTITDPNSGNDTVTVTITGDAGATITGSGITGSNPYTIAAAPAATVTSVLKKLSYQSSSSAGTVGTVTVSVSGSAGGTASASTNITVGAVVAETPYASPGTFTPVSGTAAWKGVNIEGAETTYPGTQFSYIYPQTIEINYWGSTKGFGLIRLPLQQIRLQPTAYAPLDPANRTDEPPPAGCSAPTQCNLAAIKATLDAAFSRGMRVILDTHDFGSIFDNRLLSILGGDCGNICRIAGVDAEGTAMWTDLEARLATKFQNYPNVVIDTMNEPTGMTVAQWFTANTSVISAIAGVTTSIPVLIEGATNSSGASTWVSSGNGAAWAGYTPPAGVTVYYSPHSYLDSSGAGTSATCAGTGSSRLTSFTSWAATAGPTGGVAQAILGETGWGPGSTCQTGSTGDAQTFMGYMTSNASVWLGWTYFNGGSCAFNASYVTGAQPTYTGSCGAPITGDAVQTTILVNNK